MKRNMELIRKILLLGEESDERALQQQLYLEIDGYSKEDVGRHLLLMREAGLIDAEVLRYEGIGTVQGQLLRLTWTGHDFLDDIRNETVWARTKSFIVEKGGSVSFEIVKEFARTAARSLLLPGGDG